MLFAQKKPVRRGFRRAAGSGGPWWSEGHAAGYAGPRASGAFARRAAVSKGGFPAHSPRREMGIATPLFYPHRGGQLNLLFSFPILSKKTAE